MSLLQNFLAPTVAAAVIAFLGVWATNRTARKTAEINAATTLETAQLNVHNLNYDQIQEDLGSARREAKEARDEATAARRESADARTDANRILAEQVQMRREYETQREQDRREIEWRDRYIATLSDHIYRRLPPPPPPRPEGITHAP